MTRALFFLRNTAVALALMGTLFWPVAARAEMTGTYSGCPCVGPTFPSVNFSFQNNAAYSIQLQGFRFKTPSFGGYSCFGGPAATVSGTGPYQYQQLLASWDQIRPIGSTLSSYSCGASIPGGQDGTPYDMQLLVKTGACNSATPVATPTPMACSAVAALQGTAGYYSTACQSDGLGTLGGPRSGGLLDSFAGKTQIQVGLPTTNWSISGTNVTFDPSTMGGPLYMMASAMGQEYLGLDMQFLFGIGAKESFAAMRQVPGGALFIPTNAAGVNGTYHVEVWTLGRVIMSYPNFFPRHACSASAPDVTTAAGYACVAGDGGWGGVGNWYMCTSGFGCPYIGSNSSQLVNSVFAGGMNMLWIYDALSLSTNLCFHQLLENGSDPTSAIKIIAPAYNLGINSGFEAAILPPDAADLADTDISDRVPPGNSNYMPEVMLTATRLATAASCGGAPIYDANIALADLQKFFFGNGGTAAAPADGGLWVQFPNLYSSASTRTALWNDVVCAFNQLAPHWGGSPHISYRYDFLTILRVAKQYLGLNRPFPTQSDFTSWVASRSTNATACGSSIDTAYPSLTITSPAQNADICGALTVNLTASDNVGVTAREWTLDPTWLNWNSFAGGSFTVPVSTPGFPTVGASGKVWIRITDACGNSTIQERIWDHICSVNTPTSTVSPTRTRTLTASPTPSPSQSFSPSRTRTPTPSPSLTQSSTPTRTASPSVTASLSATRSPSGTPTLTATLSRTPSVTPSVSPSRSSSPSPSRTLSSTLTRTPTPSPSATPTLTHSPPSTPTHSPSVTSSRTASPSRTATPSATPTSTISPPSTPTHSPTVTLSRTASSSLTVTPTATPSSTISPPSTPTHSPSVTSSRTASPSMTATPSETPTSTISPASTHTPSPTITSTRTDPPSQTATPTASPTFTDSPASTHTHSPSVTLSRTPSSSSTASPTASPSISDSPTNTSGPSPTFTLTLTSSATQTSTRTGSPTFSATPSPSGSPTQSLTRTLTPTRTPSPTASTTLTSSPSSTSTPAPGSPTPSPSLSPTPVPMPFFVNLSAFNSAGEQVRLIYDGRVSRLPLELGLTLDRLVSMRDLLGIVFEGQLKDGGRLAYWRGDNDAGQELEGGIYTIKATLKDPFGKVTALARQVLVLAAPGRSSLTLFNAAGETLRRWDLAALGFSGSDLQDVAVAEPPSSARPLALNLKDEGGGLRLLNWDGLNDRGLPVNSGTYTLTMETQSAQGRKVVSKSFTLLQAPQADPLAAALAGPSPLKAGAVLQIRNLPQGAGARLYSLSGELAAQAGENAGQARLESGRLGSGSYLLVLEAAGRRRLIKVAVVK